MKKSRFKIFGIIFLLFILAATPSCEAFWEAIQETNTQVDDNSDANKNGETNTSKGKGQG